MCWYVCRCYCWRWCWLGVAVGIELCLQFDNVADVVVGADDDVAVEIGICVGNGSAVAASACVSDCIGVGVYVHADPGDNGDVDD